MNAGKGLRVLPNSGPRREALRQKGQFWTPEWVAKAMVAYVVSGGARAIFDPAVGAGAFLLAARAVAEYLGRPIAVGGTEIDPEALGEAREFGLGAAELEAVEVRDFMRDPPAGPLEAIVANPPYIRHHRLAPELKAELRAWAVSLLGARLDGRAGLHVYFLLRALTLLTPQGRLSFIMPADTCEGVFAPPLWDWITSHHCLDAVITFAPEASPFPGVDTNPIIFMIRKAPQADGLVWARCQRPATDELFEWVTHGMPLRQNPTMKVVARDTREALDTGLSRPPLDREAIGPVLGDVATVMRGVVTGANDYFVLTRAQAQRNGLPPEYLIPTIARTRDVPGDELHAEQLAALDAAGRPTLLFCPDGRPFPAFPQAVRAYLAAGEELGLPARPLIATRSPWYKMETRPAPPILFAYLGRRNTRFIRNHAGVTPLTSFLCVYPRRDDPASVESLWRVLSHPDTLNNLILVGKSYGGAAIKVEPRALERLPLPKHIVESAGLVVPRQEIQLQLPS